MSGLGVITWSPSANAQQAVTLGKFVPTIQVLKVYQDQCSDLCASGSILVLSFMALLRLQITTLSGTSKTKAA